MIGHGKPNVTYTPAAKVRQAVFWKFKFFYKTP